MDLAKVAIQCSAVTNVVKPSLTLRINNCGEKTDHRKYANRWQQD